MGNVIVDLVLSLFPGLDMLGMAFEREGFCVVAGPDVCWGRDVREFHPPAGRFDGIIGGDPCQSHSTLANLVRAKGLEPRFGDLSPEFKRVVEEAQPRWFLRENVPRAPVIEPEGYAVHTFLLDNAWLDSGDGLGEEQTRKRRFWFGVRGSEAVDLRKWIRMAVFELPDTRGTTLAGHGLATGQRDRLKRQAVTHRPEAVPVKIGGSGKVKRTAVTGRNHGEIGLTGGHRGSPGRYTISQMLALQGLPETALDEAPFTAQGKRKLIGNGVPIGMGRALARAVVQWGT